MELKSAYHGLPQQKTANYNYNSIQDGSGARHQGGNHGRNVAERCCCCCCSTTAAVVVTSVICLVFLAIAVVVGLVVAARVTCSLGMGAPDATYRQSFAAFPVGVAEVGLLPADDGDGGFPIDDLTIIVDPSIESVEVEWKVWSSDITSEPIHVGHSGGGGGGSSSSSSSSGSDDSSQGPVFEVNDGGVLQVVNPSGFHGSNSWFSCTYAQATVWVPASPNTTVDAPGWGSTDINLSSASAGSFDATLPSLPALAGASIVTTNADVTVQDIDAGVMLAVASTNGDVKLSNVRAARAYVQSTNGALRLGSSHGGSLVVGGPGACGLMAASSNGDVSGDVAVVPDSVFVVEQQTGCAFNVSSTNGDIDLTLAVGSANGAGNSNATASPATCHALAGDATARTTNGNVWLSAVGDATVTAGGVVNGGGPDSWRFHTTNGNIDAVFTDCGTVVSGRRRHR